MVGRFDTCREADRGCSNRIFQPSSALGAHQKLGMGNPFLPCALPAVPLLQLREKIVSNTTGGELTIVVPNRGIWGTAGIGGKNIDGWVRAGSRGAGKCSCPGTPYVSRLAQLLDPLPT